MALIPESEIQRVKQTVDLAAYLRRRGVELKRKGKQWVGLCPMHDDHTPSLIVDPRKQLWNCLGACGEGGDVYKLVMKLDGVDFRTAHDQLSGDSESAVREKEPTKATVEEQAWLERYVAFCHQTFLESPAAQDYARSRGMADPEAWWVFRVGYADGSVRSTLSPEGRAVLTRIGVLTESGQEVMAGRLVFPLLNPETLQPVNLYGRRIQGSGVGDQGGEPGPKHLYLPGVRRGVFNPWGAKLTADVIVTESVIDAAAVWSAGIRNVVALYGVNGLTADLTRHLTDCRIRHAVLLLDSDSAGLTAAAKVAAELDRIHISSRTVLLPAKDPSEFLTTQGTPQDLRALIETSSVNPKPPASSFAAQTAAESRPGLVKSESGAYSATFANRAYTIRGLTPTPLDRLKVTLRLNLTTADQGRFHLDSFDAYQANARERFALKASKALGVAEAVVEADLLNLIEPLEGARLELRSATGKPASGPAVMSPADRAAALERLHAPDLLDQIQADIAACGLVGERAAATVGYLALLSRKLPKPLSVLVVARSGAGKSSLQDALCRFVPPEDLVRITRLTGQALFYKDPHSLTHKVLSIAEEEGAKDAIYSLRTLASDQRLSTASTRTDPNTGKLVTDHYELFGPVSIIITTTSPDAFDEETRSRFVPLTMDESRTQTRAILEYQRWQQTLDGLAHTAQAEPVRLAHHHLQRLIEPLPVWNPFAHHLHFPDDRLLARREHLKYIGLIQTLTLLHQHQRRRRSHHGIDYLTATLDDVDQATRLATAVLSRSFDELSPPVRGMLDAARELFRAKAEAFNSDLDAVCLSRRDLRDGTGWTDWQVRTYCQRLVELEYLEIVAGGNGKRTVYRLVPPFTDTPRTNFSAVFEQLKEKLAATDLL